MNIRKDVVGLTKQLHQAVELLAVDQVRDLLYRGALPSLTINNTTALHLAVSSKPNERIAPTALAILDMLLENEDADVNTAIIYKKIVDGREFKIQRTVMDMAGHNSFWDAVLLIARKRKTDAEDTAHYSSALLDAIRFCSDETLLRDLVFNLLEAGAKLNMYNREDGYYPLHWAAQKGQPLVLRMLLAKFPDEYLCKSEESKKHGRGTTAARMAFELYSAYEKQSFLDADQLAHKKQLWECLLAIAEIAYFPIINGIKEKLTDNEAKILKREKDIIFKIVCSLPPAQKWRAILAGQNERCALGKLNATQTGTLHLFGETATVALYRMEQAKMEEQGYPSLLSPSRKEENVLRASPQIFQSAPRVIRHYIGSPKIGGEEIASYSPVFHFSPPSESDVNKPPSSSPISIQPRSSSNLAPVRVFSRSSSPAPLSPLPSPSSSPRPSSFPEFLASVFGFDGVSSSSLTSDEFDAPFQGSRRF